MEDKRMSRWITAVMGRIVLMLFVFICTQPGMLWAKDFPLNIEGEVEVLRFVTKWLDLSQKNENFDEVMKLYADEVDFYKLGRVSKAAVAADKEKYFDRWPNREHLFLSLKVQPVVTDREREVAVSFHYKIKSAKGVVKEGDASTALVLRKTKDAFIILGEKDAPSASTPHAVSGDGFLVWKISQENKKGAPLQSELLWIDDSGTVVKRRKGALPVSIINGTFSEVRIEKRKVKNADCFTADIKDPDARPKLVDAEEPELSIIRTGPDGKETRTVIVAAEGDEYGDRSTEFEVLGMVGPWLFVVPKTYYYGCGAAHGGMGHEMIIVNVETGEKILAAPVQKKRADEQQRKGGGSMQTLFTQTEHDAVMTALGAKAVKAINDEMIESATELDLTKVRPIVHNDALGIEVLLTGGTCYACSDGLWDSYTRSAAFVSPVFPERLAPHRAIPPAVLKWWKSTGEKGYPSWSAVPESGTVRKQLEKMFD
ncbi:MAG: hypothetical protein A2072_03895 [Nitrospirae bacterium GWC1_57_7]|jgi:hypothetical protein|nr:MAG: hypothetical protein A2072_03895 [Nitrospirae bacterium GWC1_57_7]